MATNNENRVLRRILMSFGEDYSINEIARSCSLAPNGAFKILRKFERQGVLKPKKIANIVSYKINFEDNKTKNILGLSLIPDLEGKLKFRMEDLKELKETTEIGVIFGSYTQEKKQPNDLDILIVVNERKYPKYKLISRKVYQTIPIKVHEVIQTEEDLRKNIKKKDKVIIDILKNGVILWGQDKLIDVIKDE